MCSLTASLIDFTANFDVYALNKRQVVTEWKIGDAFDHKRSHSLFLTIYKLRSSGRKYLLQKLIISKPENTRSPASTPLPIITIKMSQESVISNSSNPGMPQRLWLIFSTLDHHSRNIYHHYSTTYDLNYKILPRLSAHHIEEKAEIYGQMFAANNAIESNVKNMQKIVERLNENDMEEWFREDETAEKDVKKQTMEAMNDLRKMVHMEEDIFEETVHMETELKKQLGVCGCRRPDSPQPVPTDRVEEQDE